MVIHHAVFLGLIRSHLSLVAEFCHHLYFLATVFFSSADGMTQKRVFVFLHAWGASLSKAAWLAHLCRSDDLWHMVDVTATKLIQWIWTKALLILSLPAMSGLALLFSQCVLTRTAFCDVTEGTDTSPSDTSNTLYLCLSTSLCCRIVLVPFQYCRRFSERLQNRRLNLRPWRFPWII